MITNKHSFEETKRNETERDDLWIQEYLFFPVRASVSFHSNTIEILSFKWSFVFDNDQTKIPSNRIEKD